MQDKITDIIESSIEVKRNLINNYYLSKIEMVTKICISCINNGGTIYFCGNGGSAADSQHLAAELSGRFYKDRKPLPSEALHCNTSYLTAVANDYGYDQVYSRIIRGISKAGDVLFGLSTSGKSKNIINAFDAAKEKGVYTIGMTGNNEHLKNICDIVICVPSTDTPRIQESTLLIGHIICELIEESVL